MPHDGGLVDILPPGQCSFGLTWHLDSPNGDGREETLLLQKLALHLRDYVPIGGLQEELVGAFSFWGG